MSTSRDDLRSWTRRQWGGMMSALLLGQLALILVFAERDPVPAENLSAAPALRAVEWPVAVENTTRQLGVSDPLLFALPNAWGFSGEAWRTASDPAPPRVEWSEPARWLTGIREWFGNNPASPEATLLAPRRPLDRPLPTATHLNIPPLPVARNTRLELSAPLQTRGLAFQPELPAMQHTNLLDTTVLRVAVEPDGALFSAVVIKTSGWDVADQRALDLVRQIKFTSQSDSLEPSNDRQWGRLQVRWATAPVDPASPNPGP